MASKSQRVMALTLAVLFLATTVATGAIVIWQVREENKAKQFSDTSSGNNSPSTIEQANEQLNQQENPNMLEGTQLANFSPSTERIQSLQVIDTTEGTGPEVKKGDNITAHYTGALVSSGKIFQSSLDSGSPFSATVLTSAEAPDGRGLIEGWVEGIPGMKVGGTRRLIIPATKAYGPGGSPPSIPGDADLVFDIQLVSIN